MDFSTFDFAACHAPVRVPDNCEQTNIPAFFPEMNSGVIFIKQNAATHQLLSKWLYYYDHFHEVRSQSWDQLSLRLSLWTIINSHDLKILVLPSEFNLRTTKPWVVGKGSFVYVIHGRFHLSELDNLKQYLNGDIARFRTWFEWKSLYPSTSLKLQIPFDPFLS